MKKWIILTMSFVLATIFGLQFLPNSVVAVSAPKINTSDKACIIMDYHSGEVVCEQNADKKLQVASIVKLMTTLLTIESIEKGNISLTDKMTTTENSAGMGGSQVFIDPFVEYTVEQMLQSVIVASANDASVALAEFIAGSEENFVAKMNKRAKELGLTNTLYANATGLPAPEEYSTARDVALLLKEVINHKIYRDYSTIWMTELTHPSGRKTEVVNTNKLVRYYKGCDGGKTGFTDEAGYCLAATAERDNMRFIVVSLGAKDSKTRFSNVSTLFNYAFANYQNTHLVSKDKPMAQIEVKMGKQKQADVFAKQDYYALTQKGEQIKYEITTDMPSSIKAPLHVGDVVGKLTITKQGKVVAEIDLIVNQNYDKLTLKDSFKDVVSHWN